MDPTEARPWRDRLPLGLAGAWAILALGLWAFRRQDIDDAYITLRYARTFWQGGGLCYNPGEHVLGYTHYLWAWAMVLALKLPWHPWITLKALSGAASLGLLASLHHWERRLDGARWPLSPFLAALYYPIAYYGALPMETAAFAALLFHQSMWCLAGDLGARKAAAGWAAGTTILMLLRPEGFAAGLGLWVVAAARSPARIRLALAGAASAAALALAYGWWWRYYGSPVPNTFIAKSGRTLELARRGAGDLYHHMRAFWPAYLGALVLLPPHWFRRRPRLSALAPRSTLACLAATQVLGVTYLLRTGGDWMPGFRFLLPQAPFALLLFALLWRRCGAIRRGLGLGLALGGCALSWPVALLVSTPMDATAPGLGRHIRALARPGDQLAIWDAGVVPYHAGIYTVDLGGLCSRRIAAEFRRGYRFNRYPQGEAEALRDSLLAWKPRFIVIKERMGRVAAEGVGPELAESPEFRRLYFREGGRGGMYVLYVLAPRGNASITGANGFREAPGG